MYKFRTMAVRHQPGDNALSETRLPGVKRLPDPRVTRLGWVLRRWSIDELPNLLNVVKGDMSLVGPRPTSWPTAPFPWHEERIQARPGITGLWQVSGRADLSVDEMARLDCEYVRSCSTALDLLILARTLGVVCSGKGAY